MKPYLVLYPSKHGPARHVAERVFKRLLEQGVEASMCDMEPAEASSEYHPVLSNYAGAVLVAPLYADHYPSSVLRFARCHAEQLMQLNTHLVSVSMAQATLENVTCSVAQRREALRLLARSVRTLTFQSGLAPASTLHVAGALTHVHTRPLTRWLIRQIAQGALDAGEQEPAHWQRLDRWTDGLAARHLGVGSLPAEASALVRGPEPALHA